MLKQTVVFVASTAVIAIVSLALAVLVRLSWSPHTGGPTASARPVPPGADKALRKA